MKTAIAFVLSLMPLMSMAESYDPYVKLTLGYILDKPDRLNFPNSEPVMLYGDNSDLSYTIETGIIVQDYRIGFALSDLISQEYESRHKPTVAQIFIDNYIDLGYLDLKLGTGFKIYEQTSICLNDDCSLRHNQNGNGGAILNRFTARIGLVKQFKHVTAGLEHHSQWFQGKPMSDEWEFHKTEFTIAYEW